MAIRRLFFDIETSPCLGWFWRPSHKTSISYNQIFEHAKIITICYKWSNQKKIYHLTWDKKQCDKQMIEKFIKVMQEADEILGHNVDKFDTRWIRTRAIYHRLSMPPDYKSIDTLKESRKGFNFPSNRLDAICRYLGIGKKIKTTEELWLNVWRNKDKKAMAEMVKYCKMDVAILEEFFNVINQYIKPKTSIADYKCECPECGSENIERRGVKVSQAGAKRQQLVCRDCKKWHSVPLKQFETAVRLKNAEAPKN